MNFNDYWDTRIDANEQMFYKHPNVANVAYSECLHLYEGMMENLRIAEERAAAFEKTLLFILSDRDWKKGNWQDYRIGSAIKTTFDALGVPYDDQTQAPNPDDMPSFVSFSHDELKNKPLLDDSIKCPHCGEMHAIEYGKVTDSKTGELYENRKLSFYKCTMNGKLYLAGIDGRAI